MKKTPFFQRIVKSIKDPLFIANAPKENTNSVIAYIFILILILTIPTGLIRGVLFSNELNDLLVAVESSDFPEFQLSGGKFSIDTKEPIIIEQGNDLILIVDISGASNINDLAGFSTGYLLTGDMLTVTMTGQSPVYYKLSTFAGFEYNKSIFINQLKFMTSISLFIVPIFFVLYSFIAILLRSLILLLLGFFLKRLLMIEKLKGSELYKMVIYSMTLGVILYELFSLLPLIFTVPISPSIYASLAPVLLFYIPSSSILSRGLRLLKTESLNTQ